MALFSWCLAPVHARGKVFRNSNWLHTDAIARVTVVTWQSVSRLRLAAHRRHCRSHGHAPHKLCLRLHKALTVGTLEWQTTKNDKLHILAATVTAVELLDCWEFGVDLGSL